MKKYQREHERHSIIHLKAVFLRIIGKKYPVIDLSAGGVSLIDEINGSGLRRELIIKNTELFLGSKVLKLDFEVVFEDKDNHIFGLKIVKFHGDSKKILAEFANCMEEANEMKKIEISAEKHDFTIASKKIKVTYLNNQLKVDKKPLFDKEEDAIVLALAILCGADKSQYPTPRMAEILLKYLKK